MAPSIPATTLEKFTTFGDLLRYLRRAAGLTQLELSIQVGYSHAQISRLEQNLRLPDIPTIEARFVPALGLESEPKTAARLMELAANIRREDAPSLGLCPYKGLNYFDETDADLFVGREALTAKLTERVLSLTSSGLPHETRFLAVVGASGSGKSSLVRAGVVPALRWNRKSADWPIHVLIPTAHPLESLAASLTAENESVAATATLMDDLLCDPRSLQIFAKRKLQAENNSHLLLVIDQFEELFTLCRSEEEKASFIGNLLAASSETDGPVTLLITLRADFYAHCANDIGLREALAQNQEYIGAMNEDELRRAIAEPARRGRWELEPGLVDLLLHDIGHEPGTLPLLSHALFETWQRRRGRVLTLGGYASSGGVRGAIAETVETVFTDQFTREQQLIARRIFLRLTELGDETSTADTRRRVTFDELILKPEETSSTHAVLKTLADARLVITNEDSVEVAHEALIREWPTLRGWLEENRESLRLHRQLTETAQEWSVMEHTPDVLYRGSRLAQAREWAITHEDEMNMLEREFLTTSMEVNQHEAEAREAQYQRELEQANKLAAFEGQRAEENKMTARQLRKRSLYLTGAFGVAIILAFTAVLLGVQAQKARLLATSRELAAASIGNLDIDPERSILLALKAVNTHYTIEAEEALHRALQASRVQLVLQDHEPGAPASVAFSPDGKHIVTASANEMVKILDAFTGKVLFSVKGHFATYSPDGKYLATVTADGTVKMWEAATGKEIPQSRQIDAGIGVDFSPDGTRLASVVSGDLPKVWDAKTGRELQSFAGHTDFVGFASFSPDGTRLITASDDGTARVWDTSTGNEIMKLADHPGWVWDASFSPDGTRIATASGTSAYIWDADSGKKLFTLAGHKDDIYNFSFSPDSTRLATGSADRYVKIWDVTSGKELFTLSGHTGAIYGLAFSPDGSRLVTGSDDGTVRIWDLTPGHELMTLSTPGGSSGQIAFNLDGTRLAATDEKGSINIWDAHSAKKLLSLRNSENQVKDLAFSPDGARVVSAGNAGIGIWDLAMGTVLSIPSPYKSSLNGMAITRDGTRLATAGDDYKAQLWDISSLLNSGKINSKPLLTLDQPGIVFSVAFNKDGSELATGIQDGTIRVWDAITGREIRILRGHRDAVLSVAFDPSGKRLATASLDSTAKVWDLASGKELFTLGGHTGAVTSIAYNPDGTRIATASRDGMAKLWDGTTGEELLTFSGDGSELNEIAFSPDGTRLAVGGNNGVHIYLLHIEDLIALAGTRVTRALSGEECQKYLHSNSVACAPTASIPTTTPFPPTTEHRICQVTNTGGLYDHSFNQLVFKGTQDAVTNFQWEAKVLQSASLPDFEKNIREFVRGDCDLIVGLPPMSDAIRLAAETNLNQKFQLMEFAYDPPLKNVWTEISATDQAAFLAGYVAASVTKTGKVGVFGGVDIPSVTDFMDGFALGVTYYNEKNTAGVEVLGWDVKKHEGLFVGEFCCAAEGRQLTQQLLNDGADIILPVAGVNVGPGAADAVQNHGNAYLIGVDTDWALSNPEYANIVITSITKNYDVSVGLAVKAMEENTFSGGTHVGTLETDEVGIAPFHQVDALVSAKVKSDLEQIKADIISGKIKTRP
jgi:WD40 repeat protein/basic membrane lipoprotein Med (substrate-binding protein (PBP1-ABC) superfamily)/transcriptional regulator with XRE-family HTH domain